MCDRYANEELMPDTTELLQQGIALARAGRREEARTILLQVVEQDERNESAWLWLSGLVDTDDDKAIALENVLTLNPNNEWAKRGLQMLGRPLPGE
jgi:Flp pilus assembly protein TadD